MQSLFMGTRKTLIRLHTCTCWFESSLCVLVVRYFSHFLVHLMYDRMPPVYRYECIFGLLQCQNVSAFSGKYGLPKPWYFPFTKSYWSGGYKDTATCSLKDIFRLRRKEQYTLLDDADDDNSVQFYGEKPSYILGDLLFSHDGLFCNLVLLLCSPSIFWKEFYAKKKRMCSL